MGVWALGPAANRVDIPGIAAAMRPALEQWMTAHVRIYDPKRATAADYDPTADTGGTATRVLVFDSGANGAIVQAIRSPTRIDVGGQANGILGVRFQIKREVAAEAGQKLRGGLIIEVVDGGNDAELEALTFSLTDIVDGSLAWDRIYDAVVLTGGR